MTLARMQPLVTQPVTITVSTRSLTKNGTTGVWKKIDGPVLHRATS